MPGAGRRARATCLFNDVQMAISQLLVARGAARHRRRRQSLDLGLGGLAGARPRPRVGAFGATRGRPGGELHALEGSRRDIKQMFDFV